jgi:hypothetical protein
MRFLNIMLLPLLALAGVHSRAIPQQEQDLPRLPEDEKPIPATLRDLFKANGMIEPQGPGWTYACHTSNASPTFSEIEGLIVKLVIFKKDKSCIQWNNVGSKCQVQANYYGGQATLCGKYGQEVMCKDLGATIEWLGMQCAKDGKASGYVVLNKDLRAVLH